VIDGQDPGGITKTAGWTGGGGFRILNVAPSMFQEDGGTVVLADWAVGGELARATAAQLGFRYEDESPFAGHKGRTRLAVVDGLVNGDVVRLLAASLGPNERMTICGTAVDPEAETVAAEVSPGSRVRKIPASILTEYRQRSRRAFRPHPVPVEVGA